MEKPLYQIAVERILGRLAGARSPVRREAADLLIDTALGSLPAEAKAANAKRLLRLLFPELETR